jgi:hypothetical protein
MPPSKAEEALYHDLLSLYARAGAEVTYETDSGDVRPYWPKRFLQAVKRAEKNGELFEFVHRLIRQDEVSRGFLILRKAGRLDLTVEALVVDERKPYHDEFDSDVVEIAKDRLADHGHDVLAPTAPAAPVASSSGAESDSIDSTSVEVPLSPGKSFDVRVTIGDDGNLSLTLI